MTLAARSLLARSALAPGVLAAVLLGAMSPGCGRTIDERGEDVEGGAGGGGHVDRWAEPPCDPVAVVDGVAVHDTAQEAFTIVALDDPNVLLAPAYGGALTRSVDAGCTWQLFPDEELEPGRGYGPVLARPGGGAYARRGDELVLVDGDAVTTLPGPAIWNEWGGRSIALFAVHATDPDQLVVSAEGELFRSFDGGHTWSPAVSFPAEAPLYPLFDRHDLDHVIGSGEAGTWVTWDAGATWTRAMIDTNGELSPAPDLGVRFGPTGDTVLAEEVLDPARDPATIPRLYRSEDGGATFGEIDRPTGRDHHMPDGDVWRTRKLEGGDFYTWPGIEIVRVVDGVEGARVEIPIERVETELVRAPNGVLYLHRGSSAM